MRWRLNTDTEEMKRKGKRERSGEVVKGGRTQGQDGKREYSEGKRWRKKVWNEGNGRGKELDRKERGNGICGTELG